MNFDRKPLTWGLRVSQIKKTFPTVMIHDNFISFGSVCIQNFPGDCGALILTRANYAKKKDLQDVVKFASMSGFSKIFATVVSTLDSPYGTSTKEAVAAFKALRFIKVNQGKSNRNPNKDDFVFVKIIRNPIHKGY